MSEERNLNGIKVLDFSRVLAGPYLTQMLCDLGAEVIKIEQPGLGADERHMSPIIDGQSGFFMMLNRGKQSLTLNLKSEEGRAIALDLVRQSDIVVENYKPGVMKSLGLSYDDLKSVKPDLIMCSISTFGQEGPDAGRPGYDIVAQATSGLLWMTGDTDRPPMRSGTSIGDVNAGAHALGAILAALYYREKTGKGQYIDIAMRDCLSAIMETAIPRYTMSHGSDKPHRSGAHHAQMAPYGVFDAGNDHYIVLGALNEAIWGRLCTVIGRPDMIKDPRFVGTTRRGSDPETRRLVTFAIEDWLKTHENLQDALDRLDEAKVPAAAVFTIEQLVNDPQFLMRDMLVEVEDPVFGKVTLPATSMRFSETTVVNPAPPPTLGQHTETILRERLGLSEERMVELRDHGVI